MSGPTGHEHQPDQAALDELGRAFADGEEEAPTPPVSPPTPPEEILIVEAVPVDPAPPPRIIRIDDYGGSVAIDDTPEDAEPASPPGEHSSGEGDAGESDAGGHDAGGHDAGEGDAGEGDAGGHDAGEQRAGGHDAGGHDADVQRAGGHDAGGHDAGEHDAGEHDAGGHDAGEHDAGEHDADVQRAGEADPVVIAIEAEDLPDAVYVEGSLDGSGPRSIVLIEDDDTLDALAPESERDIRRGIEPRMRERRVAVKRAQSRKRLKWVLLAASLVFVVVGTLAVLGSGWFAIEEDQVVVTGTVYTDPELLQAVIDDLVGTPVLVVDTQAVERRLEEIPWVETARVRTEFPHRATIEIRERQAIATYQGPDQRFRVVDRYGRVLDVIDKYPFAYVLLGGPDPVDLDAGQFAPYGYAAAADLSKSLTGSIRGRVELVEVDAAGTRLVLHLDDGVEVRFGDARDLLVKLVRLETVLSAGGVSEGGVIDVSTSQVTL